MTFDEAYKIFKVWQTWCWPCHFMLHSIFLSEIPESYLPYKQEVLEEALNIVAEQYFDDGDIHGSRNIQESIGYLGYYVSDEAALQSASTNFADPRVVEVMQIYINNFKRDWGAWLERLEK